MKNIASFIIFDECVGSGVLFENGVLFKKGEESDDNLGWRLLN
ncbi:hypothetical protein [Vibrio genomosp. F10]|nr:hypothetical protein [Vibrio genomosp. F10]